VFPLGISGVLLPDSWLLVLDDAPIPVLICSEQQQWLLVGLLPVPVCAFAAFPLAIFGVLLPDL